MNKNICLIIAIILMLAPASYASTVKVSTSASSNNGTAISHSECTAANGGDCASDANSDASDGGKAISDSRGDATKGGRVEVVSSSTAKGNTVVSNSTGESSGPGYNVKTVTVNGVTSNFNSGTEPKENIGDIIKYKIYGIVTIIVPMPDAHDIENASVNVLMNYSNITQTPSSDVLVPVDYNITQRITHIQAENANYPVTDSPEKGFWEWLFGFL